MDKVKSGIKTSEFWLALIAAIIPVLNAHLGLNIPTDAVIAIASVVITYILSRLKLKSTAMKNETNR